MNECSGLSPASLLTLEACSPFSKSIVMTLVQAAIISYLGHSPALEQRTGFSVLAQYLCLNPCFFFCSADKITHSKVKILSGKFPT